MTNEIIYKLLLRSGDVIARLCALSPFVLLLYLRHTDSTGPLTSTGAIIILSVLATFLPAIIWMSWRYTQMPSGTYPILEKLQTSARFRVLSIVVFPVLAILVDRLTQLLKGL